MPDGNFVSLWDRSDQHRWQSAHRGTLLDGPASVDAWSAVIECCTAAIKMPHLAAVSSSLLFAQLGSGGLGPRCCVASPREPTVVALGWWAG